jgi:hypothetical protein
MHADEKPLRASLSTIASLMQGLVYNLILMKRVHTFLGHVPEMADQSRTASSEPIEPDWGLIIVYSSFGNVDRVKELISQIDVVNLTPDEHRYGSIAANCAALSGHAETVKLLAATFGFGIDERWPQAVHALANAAQGGHHALSEWLVKNTKITTERIERESKTYPSVFTCACTSGCLSIVRLLLDNFNFSADFVQGGLSAARAKGNAEIMELISSRYVKPA